MPDLSTLDPLLAGIARRFFDAWHRVDPHLVVTSARRTRLEQLHLYQEAQAGRNSGLPAEPPGRSLHEKGLAFDMARPARDPRHDPLLFAAGSAWLKLGGGWSPRDPVHFGWRPGIASHVGVRVATRLLRSKSRRAAS